MPWLSDPVTTSTLALVTTVQVAFGTIRHYRSPGLVRLLVIPPVIAFTVVPWALQTLGWMVASLAGQVLWFVVCEPLTSSIRRLTASDEGQRAAPPSRRSRAFVPVQVVAERDESDEIRTFRLARPEGFTFAAGQFLTVRVQVDGHSHARCYSISSSPSAAGYLEISVRRQGLVSGALHANYPVGSVLFVKPPAGRFTYPSRDPRPLVLVAGGVGITPCISMLRHAVETDPFRRVTLLYSVRSERAFPFQQELAEIARLHSQVRVEVTVTRAEGPTSYRVGRLDEPMIRQTVDSPANSLCYLCGPTPMVETARAALLASGVPTPQIHDEVFLMSAAIGAKKGVAGASIRATLGLAVSGLEVDVQPGKTLLEAAECAGAQIPSLCRSGVCGTCKTRLVSGNVEFSSDALDPEDLAQGYILPCVAWPAGDCSLEA